MKTTTNTNNGPLRAVIPSLPHPLTRPLRAAVASVLLLIASMATAEDVGWPVEIEAEGGWTVTLYQPQVDDFVGNDLETRAAVSVVGPGVPEPVFGAVWITARLDVDRDARVVRVAAVRVPDVRFAEASEEAKQKLARLLESEIPTWNIEISLDRFLADLEAFDERTSVQGLKHDPPTILFSTEPALLLTIDGEPRLREIPGQVGQRYKVQYVVNTPFPVMYDPRSEFFYLFAGGDLWYRASEPTGDWEPTRAIPSTVKYLAPEQPAQEEATPGVGGAIPSVIAAVEPTELIVSAGEPRWSAIEGLELEYLANSDTAVLRAPVTGSHYVLLSGRWYRSDSLDGPWQFVEPDRLPGSFLEIPADGPVGDVRVHVAGTREAREAVLDSQIPETSAVRRDATVFVRYDGRPQFEAIEGTELAYAVNTSSQVIKVGDEYYCCEQGVWYRAPGPKGPWKVAVEVPEAIYTIPPSNPHHNVTYVQVYEATEEVVHVGYTPGYMGSYTYGGCTVYGTGWDYRSWYGESYYPWQSTWGFHSAYNPWTGSWGFGVGWSNGPVTITIGVAGWGSYYGGAGWFGVGGYYPHPRAYPYPGYTRPGSGVYEGHIPWGASSVGGVPSYNVYGRSYNADRVVQGYGASSGRQPRYASGAANNVYADPSGNVYRRTQNGSWEQRVAGGWNPSVSGPQSLQRDYSARQRGAERTQQYRSRRP
jgi:hypothetical protein